MTVIEYRWLHIPSGRQGKARLVSDLPIQDVQDKIVRWNNEQPGVWQYWIGLPAPTQNPNATPT